MGDSYKNDSSQTKQLRRRGAVKRGQSEESETKESGDAADNIVRKTQEKMEDAAATSSAGRQTERSIERGTYWLTRIVLLRYLGFIYFIAFLVAYHQNKQLIGSNGLLPGDKFLKDVKAQTDNKLTWTTVSHVPSILWLFDYGNKLNVLLDHVAITGLCLSGFLMVYGAANWFIMLTLWVLYHSLVNIGQRWYGFGWESQLLETGFLATFLCPVWSLRRLPRNTPTSIIIIFGFRWLIFRIMMGAGLIKIRGDKCWLDLTCMNYHYETQPVPNPMSYFMHQSPALWHKVETMGNHIIELVAPILLLMPYAPLRNIGGAVQIMFQVILIISGNLSFLNWLTILPCLACYDDVSLAWMFPHSVRQYVTELQQTKTTGAVPKPRLGSYMRAVFNLSLGVLIAYLSIPVVSNLLSTRQAMNTSFDPLRLVNTYGAFGSITKKRHEVIFQGTSSADPYHPSALWEEYEFKCKPGNISRTPCLISPYHYRLDWLMWFAAFQSYERNPWLVHLAVKLLVNDEEATSLIEHNPFMGKDPPKFIQAEHYLYRYTKIGSPEAKKGQWWHRTHKGNYMPPISLEAARPILRQMGWKMPKVKMTEGQKHKH